MNKSTKTKISQRIVPLILVLLVGISLSAAAFFTVREKEMESIRGDFFLAAKNLSSDLRRTLENNLDVLPLIRALFYGSEHVTQEEFREFVKPILLRNPHITALGWVRSVNSGQWLDFLRCMEKNVECNDPEPFGGPTSLETAHFPVFYLDGRNIPQIKLGDDLSLLPEMMAALKTGAEQGKMTSVPLLRTTENGHGGDNFSEISFFFFLPVFGKNLAAGKGEVSEEALNGFVFGFFPLKEVLEEVLARYQDAGIAVSLYDRDDFGSRLAGRTDHDRGLRGLVVSETFSLADRDLVVISRTMPGFVGQRMSWRPQWTLAGGLVVTALLFGFLISTFRRSGQIELLAEQLSTEVIERKRVADAREKLVAELEAKNAELERFTYTVSHDLKSPLITIRGFSGLLAKDAEKGDMPRVYSDVEQIKRATDKMQQLLEELLELSRIGRLVNPSKTISLSELVGEAVEILAGRIENGAVEVSVQEDMPMVFGDRPRLLEVFQNLIENAIKFMGNQSSPRVEIWAEKKGEDVLCYVRDNGIGIPGRYQNKIFGLFERLDQTLEGTGIGLALVKRIIQYHGGRIWIDSEGEGKGSTFVLSLPLEMKEVGADENKW
ncbi:MAG: GHKL domain-containing protein [Desulfuromonadaceae bacterium]|nr:GHKL domain-containing protein [Desulfuromonadaceae bacterium]